MIVKDSTIIDAFQSIDEKLERIAIAMESQAGIESPKTTEGNEGTEEDEESERLKKKRKAK